MNDDTPVEDATPRSLKDKKEGAYEHAGSALTADIIKKFERSKINRKETENRWLKSYNNFRGRYGDDVQFLSTEVSRVFIKVTKTKTLAAYGQILDILLSSTSQFPITIGATEKPLGVPELVHVDPASQGGAPEEIPSIHDVDVIGYEGDDNPVIKGESLMDRAVRIVSSSLGLQDKPVKLEEGGASKAGQITLDPADIAAAGMNKKIQDQLTEANISREFRKFLFEMCLLGAGALKGPFLSEKEYPRWTEDGEYDPIYKTVPLSNFVSIWNIYNDINGSSVEDSEWLIERHKYSAQELRALSKQPYFREEVIEDVIQMGANYMDEPWETTLREGTSPTTTNKFEVLEYWGVMDVKNLESLEDKAILDGLDEDHEVNINAFICNGVILRLIVNPFKPSRIPYYVCPYEEDPYNFFGVGLAENMEDSQVLMNGFARMAVDNAVLAGNIMLEVDTDNLSPDTTMDIYPGKIWKREGGQPGSTINAIKFPNTAQENLQLYDKFRQLADESTGISSFAHGQTGITGIGRTASGISMLMNAASGSIKTVIKNIDDYVLEPMGKAYFAFNNQFDFDPTLAGDLEVKPMGVSSLMAKEVKSQRLLQLIQVLGADPEMSMRLNKEYIAKEITKSLELDPDKAVLSPEEYQLKVALGIYQQEKPAGPPVPPGGPSIGGDMGLSEPAMPGEANFSGTPQPQGMPQQ